ncbi:hypothetical protein [Caulobacter endophyticus]|uniref:hypothetical protein n=1 Tax=Caulobacter endophyticus TaxID=2172652 RepID=UPI00240FE865|nr:hypothetical protein [Caulobacter endophyticus]MDG2529155.1 hypothetical protein [Caulobacter endophyticus]
MIRRPLSNHRANPEISFNSLIQKALTPDLPFHFGRLRRFLPSGNGKNDPSLAASAGRRRGSDRVGAILALPFSSSARRMEPNALYFNGLHNGNETLSTLTRQVSPGKVASRSPCFAERTGDR